MDLAAKLDSFGKPAWIALTILAFWFWWPLGLAALAFLIGSGRMACWRHGGAGRWYRPEPCHHLRGSAVAVTPLRFGFAQGSSVTTAFYVIGVT